MSIDKRISEFDIIEEFDITTKIPIIQGSPLKNGIITPKDFAESLGIMTDDELNDMIHIYDKYQVNYPYIKEDRFHYEGKLYEVIQPHTSLENWKPNELPALYKEVMPKQVIPEWVKPTGSHDAYKIGDKVIFEGDIWVSKIDNNTWSPTEYPTGWNKE